MEINVLTIIGYFCVYISLLSNFVKILTIMKRDDGKTYYFYFEILAMSLGIALLNIKV